MDFEIKTMTLAQAAEASCDALVVLLPQGFEPAQDAVSELVRQARSNEDIEFKAGKLLVTYQCTGVAARRVLLAGVGEGSAGDVRKAVNAAVGAIKTTGVKRLCICFAWPAHAAAVAAAVVASADASYVYTTTKSKPEPRKLERVTLGVGDEASVRPQFERAAAVVQGVEVAKEWANRPANHATPAMLADVAKALCKKPKFDCEVMGPKEVAKLGMGAFLAVAKASVEPLRFIVLQYRGAAKSHAPVVLVGKGITFDTGGISIKPAAEMDEMKFDMSGAASVLGVFRALAELKPALNVVGLIPATENMPGGAAVKPGDVVTSMSGQTIEVLNTDAEGRLVLCDALTYAERFEPRAVIDMATLTGACVIALGGVRSGLFSPDDALAASLIAAGDAALDPCWRMPLDEEYAEGLKSNFADVPNIAGRAAGAVTAAKFLERFAGKFPWAHLDIAGTAWKSGAAKGATGRPVGLLIEYLLTQSVADPVKPSKKGSTAASSRKKNG
ncbi:MAG: leucyl aminopeptidase [Burkholderiales bacterium]